MADIAELGFKVDTREIKQGDSELKKLGNTAQEVERKTGRASKSIAVGAAAVGAAAVGAAVAVAAIYAKQSQLIDQNAKLAQSLGTTYTGLANMQRAAELSGVSTSGLEQATKDLTRRLSQAASGTGPAVQALERLNLTAGQLAQMPLDQRIETINRSIRDFIPAAERAAVAGQLFGEEGSLAMQRISPETIAEAARQVEVFGLNLSDVDAAKVEMANDAFSTFSMAADGIGKQLAVELAPLIKAVSDLFFESAEEAGGMGNVVREAVDTAVRAVAFAVDAVDGLGRVFTRVTSGAAIGIAKVFKGISDVQLALLELIKMVPGMSGVVETPLAAMETISSAAQAVIESNGQKIQDALNQPLRGRLLIEAADAARAAAEAQAQLVVRSRTTNTEIAVTTAVINESTSAVADQTSEVDKQISALERAAATWGMTREQLALYDLQLSGATGTQLAYAQSLIDTVAAMDAKAAAQEEESRKQEEINARAMSIMDEMRTEEQVIADSYARRRDIVLAATFETEEARTAILEQLEIERNERLRQIELARTTAVLEMNQQLFGGLAGLAKSYAGEQSGLYRAMFAVEQGFAIAKALMNAPTAFSEAYTATVGIPVVGPALAPIAGATAAAAQVAQAGAIRGIAPSFDGGGHTGYGPRTGGIDGKGGFPAILHPQERVIDEYRGQSAGGSQVINFNLSAPENRRTQEQIARKMAVAQQRQQARLG